MNKILILAILFISVGSCKKKSENQEDYIHFMINNEFKMKYYKNEIKGIEWDNGVLKSGIFDANLVRDLKFKFYIKNMENKKIKLYYTAMSGLVNTYVGEIDLVELNDSWKQNKTNIGEIQLSTGTVYKIDLINEEFERKSKNETEKLEKIKS